MRVCSGEPRALQGTAQRDLHQRTSQNYDRQDSEVHLASTPACDRSAITRFSFFRRGSTTPRAPKSWHRVAALHCELSQFSASGLYFSVIVMRRKHGEQARVYRPHIETMVKAMFFGRRRPS